MRISVIVSNFNGARYLPRLLDSLGAQRGVDLELIVVDRDSRDGSGAILAGRAGVAVLQEPPETGLAAGYARGAARASGELLFFCNEDMWFDPDCLRLLQEAIDLTRGIVAADPWQWRYDGSAWIHGGVRFREAAWDLDSPYPFRRFDFVAPLEAGAAIPLACAGAFLIHRGMFEAAGGWDTRFFLNDEDTDLFLRVWQREWRCVTVPAARVFHDVGASNAQHLSALRLTVGKRRYISTFASKAILGVKYFGFPACLLPVAGYAVRLGSNLVKCRPVRVGWDLRVLAEILRRLPSALGFRRRNAAWNRRKPGEGFFRDPGFSGS